MSNPHVKAIQEKGQSRRSSALMMSNGFFIMLFLIRANKSTHTRTKDQEITELSQFEEFAFNI